MKRWATVIFLLASTAAAPAQTYVAPDKELWEAMAKAIDDLPMSATAHQQVQNILASVAREAAAREARAKAVKPEDQK